MKGACQKGQMTVLGVGLQASCSCYISSICSPCVKLLKSDHMSGTVWTLLRLVQSVLRTEAFNMYTMITCISKTYWRHAKADSNFALALARVVIPYLLTFVCAFLPLRVFGVVPRGRTTHSSTSTTVSYRAAGIWIFRSKMFGRDCKVRPGGNKIRFSHSLKINDLGHLKVP